MFYGSPFPHQPGSGQGVPTPSTGPGIPPTGLGIPPAGSGLPGSQKPPEEVAFQEVRAALKPECRDNIPLLMAETKKLGVAVLEACELLLVANRRSLSLNQVEVLRQELQNQVMAYALMRFLPDDSWKAAAEACAAKIPQGLAESPPVGKAGLFVRELEALVPDTPRNQEFIKQWLLAQPLFRVLNQKPEIFTALEEHYPACAGKMNQMIQSTNESLSTLLQQQSQLRPGGGFRPH